MKTQRKISTYKKKEKKRSKRKVGGDCLYSLSVVILADLVPEAFTHIEDFINQILNGLNF